MTRMVLATAGLVIGTLAACQTASDSPASSTSVRVIATFDGRDIKEEDLVATSLESLIIDPLFDQYRARKGITASQQEIEACFRCIFRADDPIDAPLVIESGDEEALEFATNLVVNWKTDRQLYADYGGTVIFQQLNPTEPVGAYLAFLQEQERLGVFRIHDQQRAADFWDYYLRDHPGKVRAQAIDYSIPWWEKIRNSARAVGR